MKKKMMIVSVISELTTDQRVLRICTTLQEIGFNVHLIGRKFKDSLPLDQYNFTASRIHCYFRKGFLQYAEFNSKLFFKLLFIKVDYLLSNDLDTLVPNYIISKWRRKKIFYDTHEYYTGVPELKDANLKRKVWKFFENWIFPRLPVVYTVNESVKNKYKAEYGNQISVVRNVPITEKIVPKEIPKNWDNKIILLMQGIGINPGRGGMELLETMKYLSPNYHLVFIGGGTLWNEIAQKRIEWNLEERVEMISKIKPAELKQYTRLAHLGFTLDGFENTNFLFNLPNKIFDYIHANIPVIATAIPEVKAIINQYKCGICLKTTLPSEIAPEIENLINNKEYYQLLKHNTIQAAKELCWEIEKQKIISIYKQYI